MLRNDEELYPTSHIEYDYDLCFAEGFDPFAVEPGDIRLANLYDRSMDCSDSFLQIVHQRLLNPGLAFREWTDYLVAQHSDLQTYCNTSMPLTGMRTSSLVLGTMFIPAASPSAIGTWSTRVRRCSTQRPDRRYSGSCWNRSISSGPGWRSSRPSKSGRCGRRTASTRPSWGGSAPSWSQPAARGSGTGEAVGIPGPALDAEARRRHEEYKQGAGQNQAAGDANPRAHVDADPGDGAGSGRLCKAEGGRGDLAALRQRHSRPVKAENALELFGVLAGLGLTIAGSVTANPALATAGASITSGAFGDAGSTTRDVCSGRKRKRKYTAITAFKQNGLVDRAHVEKDTACATQHLN